MTHVPRTGCRAPALGSRTQKLVSGGLWGAGSYHFLIIRGRPEGLRDSLETKRPPRSRKRPPRSVNRPPRSPRPWFAARASARSLTGRQRSGPSAAGGRRPGRRRPAPEQLAVLLGRPRQKLAGAPVQHDAVVADEIHRVQLAGPEALGHRLGILAELAGARLALLGAQLL